MTNIQLQAQVEFAQNRLNSPATRALHADIVAVILSHVVKTDLNAYDLRDYLTEAAKGASFTAAFARDDRESLTEKLRYELDTANEAAKG